MKNNLIAYFNEKTKHWPMKISFDEQSRKMKRFLILDYLEEKGYIDPEQKFMMQMTNIYKMWKWGLYGDCEWPGGGRR